MRCCSRYLVAIMSLLLATSAAAREAELEQLTRDGQLKFTPVFHDGGKELVFVEQVNPTLYQIRRLVLATGADEPLHANAPTSEFEPRLVSRRGLLRVPENATRAMSVSIMIRDRHGVDLGEILPAEGFCGYRSPALAPDHSRVAYSYAEKGTQQIYSRN